MTKFAKIVGYAWACPVSLFGLIYAGLFGLLGWYGWGGVHGDALVWIALTDRTPSWLRRLWEGWGGHAIGNVVVMTQMPAAAPTTLLHEQQHVRQCMRLGVFQPLMYGLNMLVIKLGCPNSHHYLDNPFEIDARRGSGQTIDVRR